MYTSFHFTILHSKFYDNIYKLKNIYYIMKIKTKNLILDLWLVCGRGHLVFFQSYKGSGNKNQDLKSHWYYILKKWIGDLVTFVLAIYFTKGGLIRCTCTIVHILAVAVMAIFNWKTSFSDLMIHLKEIVICILRWQLIYFKTVFLMIWYPYF